MEDRFYVPEDESYTIFDSMSDSVRFAVERTLTRYKGHLCCKSSFVNPEGEAMEWHEFGCLEGPGWAANALGGAYELCRFGRFTGNQHIIEVALSIVDHVLEDGFIDETTGFIIGYRDTVDDRLYLNFKHDNSWFCPGSMAKVAYQLLILSDLIRDTRRCEAMKQVATRCAEWIHGHVKLCDNGWFPRRVSSSGDPYPEGADGGSDPIFMKSADGLFIIQLMADLTRRGLADHRSTIEEETRVFTHLGCLFGSINHDTYDEHENVSYAVAFRVLDMASNLIGDHKLKAFAYEKCLEGLDQFKMTRNRNGVDTKGLLFMERSWDTAYLWENAEAALAYLEAYGERGNEEHLGNGLTILRAAAKHHHGQHGFLTEGVDWNNHVGRDHHIDGTEFGDIRYTEPLLNNLHIAEPTLEYLEKFARRRGNKERTEYHDFEGNLICTLD